MANTGGPLNLLNGKMGISDPSRSVPVIKLIKTHNPKSKEELVELIRSHYENRCVCGIVSKGTIEIFGKNLYESQIAFWGEYRFSLKECIQWEYDLFIVQSLKGGIIEKKAIKKLFEDTPEEFKFEETYGIIDEEFRIDMVILRNSDEIGGIQVKPLTFNKMRSEVITFNLHANRRWGKPVFYLFYDEKEEFVNYDELIQFIKKL